MFDKEFILSYFGKTLKRVSEERIFEREMKISPIKSKAIAIVGPRRSGKTYFLYNLLKERLSESIYFDFEHSAFKNVTHRDVFEIIPIFEEYFNRKIKVVLLDEIQRVEEWERLVRSLLDSGYEVIVTGSSSKLMSKEIATHLRGRSLTYFLLPLSFKEYLGIKRMEIKKLVSIEQKVKILKELENFLEWGSYPEVVVKWEQRERLVKEYFETILYKDFIERFEANVSIARLMFEFIFQNFSKEMSINKIANFVSSNLRKDVKNLVYEYADKMPETLSVFFLEKLVESVYKRKSWNKKFYVCDTGLSNVLRFSKDFGRRMENVVFLELMRKTNEFPLLSIYYWKDYQQHEVDFVIKEELNIKQLIQVTYSSSLDEIEKRELRSLVKVSNLLKCKNLLVITWDFESEEEIKGKKIKFLPLWKWLLGIKI